MEEIHIKSAKDAVVAGVLIKSLELMGAWGVDVAKVHLGQEASHIYVQNSEGRVIEAFVRDKLDDGRQFIDYEIYTVGGNDYQQWSASSPENFNQAIDEDILGLSAQTARFG